MAVFDPSIIIFIFQQVFLFHIYLDLRYSGRIYSADSGNWRYWRETVWRILLSIWLDPVGRDQLFYSLRDVCHICVCGPDAHYRDFSDSGNHVADPMFTQFVVIGSDRLLSVGIVPSERIV